MQLPYCLYYLILLNLVNIGVLISYHTALIISAFVVSKLHHIRYSEMLVFYSECLLAYNKLQHCRCPLYSEDLEELDRNAVLHAANEAKAELGVTADPGKLKFDPTKNFNQQFQ